MANEIRTDKQQKAFCSLDWWDTAIYVALLSVRLA